MSAPPPEPPAAGATGPGGGVPDAAARPVASLDPDPACTLLATVYADGRPSVLTFEHAPDCRCDVVRIGDVFGPGVGGGMFEITGGPL